MFSTAMQEPEMAKRIWMAPGFRRQGADDREHGGMCQPKAAQWIFLPYARMLANRHPCLIVRRPDLDKGNVPMYARLIQAPARIQVNDDRIARPARIPIVYPRRRPGDIYRYAFGRRGRIHPIRRKHVTLARRRRRRPGAIRRRRRRRRIRPGAAVRRAGRPDIRRRRGIAP